MRRGMEVHRRTIEVTISKVAGALFSLFLPCRRIQPQA